MISTITACFNRAVERHIEKRRYSRMAGQIVSAVDRYAAKKKPAPGQKELRWITIGGGEEEGGGTHVQIDGDGKIVAGPKGLADKGVTKLSDFGGDRDGGATTAQRHNESGVTESEAASRKWKKNDDGTYTAPNGTIWKKAAAGGEESPVNGKQYAGGSLMPIHGLSEKPAKQKPAENGNAAPSSAGKPNEDAKRKQSAAMTPEQIAAEKEAREDRRKWSELSSGPMGKLKWLGESPNHRAMKDSRINLKEWTEFADQIGPEATSALAEKLKDIAHKRIDDATAAARKNSVSGMPIPNDAEQWQKDQISERAGEDARLHGMKKHVKGNPDSLVARQLIQEILDNDNNPSGKSPIDNLLDVNRILSDAANPLGSHATPTKATESQGTPKQKEAEESAQQSAAGDAAKAAGNPASPKAGDTYDFPAIGDRSPIGLRVTAVNDSHVGVGMKDSDLTWVKIPKGSFHSFIQDMSGKIEVPETDDPHISRIRSGEAKMLGRGDDGLVFDTGDGKVTKVSTTTPFQPLNPFHRTPDEAKKRAIDQFNTAKALHQAGVPGIPRMSAKEHGDRVFTTRENLKIPEKLTADQLRQTRDSLRAMHDQGYSLNDEVQVGIGADGKVYHFDLGKAAKAEHPDDFKGDQGRLDRLAEKSGLPRIAINPQKEWGEYKGMLDNRKASDERRQQQVKDGVRPASQAKSLVEDFRRIVGENLARLRDQMVSENPSDADRIRAEHAEMMGEAATPPAAPVPQSPPPKPTVAGTQSGLFDRDEMTTGQKSLFNVVRPAKGGAKKPVAPDLLAGVTADVRAHLERKGTLSPADVSGTSLQAESLEGQKEMFSRIRGAMSRGVARYRLAGGSRY